MKAGIYVNRLKDESESAAGVLRTALVRRGIEFEEIREGVRPGECDVVIVLGGDGTILNIAGSAAACGVPILGINTGTMGFLAEFELSEIDEAVKLLKEGALVKGERSMLETEVNGTRVYALNEFAVQRVYRRDALNQVVRLNVCIDGQLVDQIVSDGIIVSTPTGSTAYSLSAGGAIMSPDIRAFCLTPVCAHSLRNRPIVYSETSVLSADILSENVPALFADGKLICDLKKGTRLSFGRAERSVVFLRKKNSEFYGRLLLKLNKWSTNG